MASTFSPSLRIELIGDGDQSGIWGQTTNNNLGGLIEQAVTGVITLSLTDTNYTLSNFNGVVDESRNAVLVLTGTLSTQRNLIAPLVEKTYNIKNSTTGGFGVQIIGSSGTGVVIPNGQTIPVYCDGTNFYALVTGAAGNFSITGNLAVTGTTALTGALTASTANFSGAISSVSPAFTGTPTSPTAAPGTSTTQIATTAFVQNVAGALGTMSSQNANNVAITGGSISGVSGSNPSMSVGSATTAGNGGVTSVNGQTGAVTISTAPTSGAGGLGNGTSFSITTGSSGVALITVEFLTIANVGNFGGATGYLDINGSTVASKYTQTIEFSSRNSGCPGTILYRHVGSPNTSYTGTFSWGGTGNLNSASYMYIGI